MMTRHDDPAPRPSALERMMRDDAERFGSDYVRGRTELPERPPPVRERRPIFERPTGPEDFR